MDLGIGGRTAFVSGAHRGTGAVIARLLAEEGAHVIVHGLEPGDADEVAAAILKAGGNADPVSGDLTSDAGASATAAAALACAPRIDILINNWGGVARGRWSEPATDVWIEDYQRNVLSMVRLSKAFAPGMREAGWGRIVNLGTLGTVQPPARTPHYYAAKSALAGASASLARELGPAGITVNLVSPGLIRTAEVEAHFRQRAEHKGWGTEWADIERHALEEMGSNPLGRMSTREEVANAVLFLASEPASHISGVNLRVDGAAAALSL